MRNLIPEKFTVTSDLPNLDYADYFENIFLSMFFTPKHLKLFACGSLIGAFVNNPDEGYRTLVPIKITQIQPLTKNPQGQGGARKAPS